MPPTTGWGTSSRPHFSVAGRRRPGSPKLALTSSRERLSLALRCSFSLEPYNPLIVQHVCFSVWTFAYDRRAGGVGKKPDLREIGRRSEGRAAPGCEIWP